MLPHAGAWRDRCIRNFLVVCEGVSLPNFTLEGRQRVGYLCMFGCALRRYLEVGFSNTLPCNCEGMVKKDIPPDLGKEIWPHKRDWQGRITEGEVVGAKRVQSRSCTHWRVMQPICLKRSSSACASCAWSLATELKLRVHCGFLPFRLLAMRFPGSWKLGCE